MHRGALWVGAQDGRIEGIDWEVKDEEGLQRLIEKMGWKEEGSSRGVEDAVRVRIVKERKGTNGFFFPGFVGRSSPLLLYDMYVSMRDLLPDVAVWPESPNARRPSVYERICFCICVK